ncbi:hypothetical protein D9M69_369200 [compost metagenome]
MSSGQPYQELDPVPPDRQSAFKEEVPGPSGEIIITRDSGFLGGGCYFAALVDGVVAARLAQGEYVKLKVKAGEHIVGLATDRQGKGMCSSGYDQFEQSVIVNSGETKRFRMQSGPGGFDIKPTTL